MSIFDQADALITHWLNQTPADDFDDYLIQARQATWLEERHYEALGQIMGVKK